MQKSFLPHISTCFFMRKTVAMTALVTLLLMAMATLTAITTAQSTGSYIPQPDLLRATIQSNGTVTPESANITRNGNTYQLSSDLDGYIIIEQSNIVFDGQGHSIKGVYGPIPIQSGTQSQVDGLTGTTIQNVVVENGGIIFYGYLKSNNLVIVNNTVNSGTGIDCSGNGNLVANNTINKGRGIGVAGNGNIISGNNLQGCDQWKNPVPYGISLYGSNNKIFANTIAGTQGYAIDLLRVTTRPNNVIAGNQITNNQVGVHTSYAISQGGAEGNLIYKNNFVGNGQNVYNEAIVSTTVSVNFWDDGKEGNYWSNYNGQGTYVIDQSNVDNHPLSSPVDISKLTIESLSSVPIPTFVPTPTLTSSPSTMPSPTATLTPTPTSQPSPTPTVTPSLPPRNAPHLDPVFYLIPVSVILTAVVVLVLFFRNHRKPISQNKPNEVKTTSISFKLQLGL
jgi:hypothetical protein